MMASRATDYKPASKRRKLNTEDDSETESEPEIIAVSAARKEKSPLTSLDRSITPPPGLRAAQVIARLSDVDEYATNVRRVKSRPASCGPSVPSSRVLPSPVQLTRIRDLPAAQNVDCVGLRDILGDPLIRECWQFNFLFDVDFLLSTFDEDVRSIVQIKVVHGSWKKDDMHRLSVEEAAKRYPNVQVITAHMPEAFGTHHTKMMILIRHDDSAQVIIHTANMIPQDWTNLCQAVWRSPLLPLLPGSALSQDSDPTALPTPIGSGQRFKTDLLRYLGAYSSRTRPLVEQLKGYDFSSIRAALIASTPCRQRPEAANPPMYTSWGWPGLQEILRTIPCNPTDEEDDTRPSIVIQISSVATLTEKWITEFFKVLGTTASPAASSSKGSSMKKASKPSNHIIFPTADEIRRSLDGYASGASIHMKLQSAAQQKQLALLKPMLCHWTGDAVPSASSTTCSSSLSLLQGVKDTPPRPPRKALRRRAAPHIKTYVRFSDQAQTSIDWAMVSSANLSTQAWGGLRGKDGEVRICSWEVGVVVWPALFREAEGEEVRMVPVFGRDGPEWGDVAWAEEGRSAEGRKGAGESEGNGVMDKAGKGKGKGDRGKTVVGFRMPYDLPLVPYGKDEVPWCATASHLEPDWKGVVWEGYCSRV